MTSYAGQRWQQIAWLGLCILPCLVVGAFVGTRIATALGIAVWVGQVGGFVAAYLVTRTVLRRYFVHRL